MHTFQPTGDAGRFPKCLYTEFTLTKSTCQCPSNSAVVRPFHLFQSAGCEMIPHYDFNWRFSILWKSSTFSHLLVIRVSTFCELPVRGLYPFLFRLLPSLITRRRSLYLLHAHYLLMTNCVYLCLVCGLCCPFVFPVWWTTVPNLNELSICLSMVWLSESWLRSPFLIEYSPNLPNISHLASYVHFTWNLFLWL